MDWIKFIEVHLMIGIIEAFIVIPLWGNWLEKHCKKQCSKKCKLWNCPKWHDIDKN